MRWRKDKDAPEADAAPESVEATETRPTGEAEAAADAGDKPAPAEEPPAPAEVPPAPAADDTPESSAAGGPQASGDGETETPAAADRPSRGRTALRRVGATTSALLLLGAAAGAVVAAQYLTPEPSAAVTAPLVDVPAGPVTAVCAGPPTLTSGDGMSVDPDLDPADVTPASRTQLLTLPRPDAAAGAATFAPLEGDAQPLARKGGVRALVTDPAAAGIVQAEPVGEVSALLAGATVARTNAGDLRGLVATACQAPSSSSWLVGGASEPGASSQLVLTNPGRTPVTANVTVWTSLGVTDAPLLRDVVIAPGKQTEVLLEAAVTSDPRLALRVDADGGEVTAVVQDAQLSGFVPAGVDAVTPAGPPALRQTIPGVVLGESGIDDAASSAVRLVNPGEEVATARVALLGPEGEQAIAGAEEVAIDPGAVLDLSLAGIAPGAYAVAVESDVPVTGAVVLARPGKPGELDPDVAPVDRAWTAAAAPLSSATLPVPALGQLVDAATVTLSNPAETPVEVELVPVSASGARGKPVEVSVPARATVARPAADLGGKLAAVELSAPDGITAAVVLTAKAPDGELISVLPPTADPHAQRAVRVDVR
ncbi:DUF5719 family protein [Georgenia thermotolerans]|uniref:Large extracellular alpha-helical protein n=1 Tax=Georgenia thermotolerans TaxID=527326 RepID=A0A7J5US25_9MICO|nr:DUF5719 family protein [Georgenia thermotolerans]KAE8765060.1 hypothetical protein GB883_05555 [Georgenia thermotolerans]